MFVCVPVSLNLLLIAKNASKRTENDDFFLNVLAVMRQNV